MCEGLVVVGNVIVLAVVGRVIVIVGVCAVVDVQSTVFEEVIDDVSVGVVVEVDGRYVVIGVEIDDEMADAIRIEDRKVFELLVENSDDPVA